MIGNGTTGLLLSAFLGWMWERFLEGKVPFIKGFWRIIFVFVMCVLTAFLQVLYEANWVFPAMNMGQWFGYLATIFLVAQGVWELRGQKLEWVEIVEEPKELPPPDVPNSQPKSFF